MKADHGLHLRALVSVEKDESGVRRKEGEGKMEGERIDVLHKTNSRYVSFRGTPFVIRISYARNHERFNERVHS